MNRLYGFILIIAFFTISIYAQDEDRTRKMPEGSGHVSGIVLDKTSNQPLTGVIIQIFKMMKEDSSKVKGGETDDKGKFNIEIPYGRYKVEFSYVGYNDAVASGIMVLPKNPDVVLDTVRLKQGGTTTEEIEVTGEKTPFQFTADKKIFNVSQDPMNSSGTATDVLRNVPSVSVDSDGNVSLRGSGNVRIFIDGRPVLQNSRDLLATIPANQVETVELVTNPGAKFDAEGEVGIINITLKKNSGLGYNSVLTLGAGTKDKYNGGINLNLKDKKFNVFGSYSYNSHRGTFSGSSFRNNFLGTVAFLDQPSSSRMNMRGHNAKFGFDYIISDKQTLTFNSGFNSRNRVRNETSTTSSYDINNNLLAQSTVNSIDDGRGTNLDFTLNFLQKFKEPKQTLTLEATYSRNKDEGDLISSTQDNINTGYQPYQQKTFSDGIVNSGYFTADYVHPLNKDSKIEAGLKSSIKKRDDDYIAQYYDTVSGQYVENTARNNHFIYDEYINAGYVTYSNKIKDFSFQLGLRSEYSYVKGNLLTNNISFNKKYIDFFPSVSLSQKIGMANEVQLTYSRRFNRPSGRDLVPFTDYSDPYNIRQGNPNLNPEYINSFELSYLRFFTGTFLTGTVFYRQTNDLITRFRTILDSVTTLTTQVNLAKSNSYGIELIANTQPTDWFNASASFSYFNTKIDAGNVQADLSNEGNSWSSKIMTNFKMWGGINLSLLYNYNSRRPTVLGFFEPTQSFDANIKKDFLNGRLSVGIRATDIFDQQKFNIIIDQPTYYQTNIRKRDSRGVFLNVTFKLGNMFDQKQQRPDRRKKPEDNTPGDDGDL